MKRSIVLLVTTAALVLSLDRGVAQQVPAVLIKATTAAELRTWDGYVTARERSGELQVMRSDRDPSLPSRIVERLQQFHEGVPVWGAQVVRDTTNGVPESMFGDVSPSLSISTTPTLSSDEALRLFGAGAVSVLRRPELTVLRLASGEAKLAYTSVARTDAGIFRIFIDANTGAELLRYSAIETQSAVGTGRGLLGDEKKLSVTQQAGGYFADDQLRPPDLTTYDMRANFGRFLNLLDGLVPFVPSDVASDADNNWTDVSAVDAHASIGWTYDYYFKRHGRRGLDNRDRRIATLINAATPQGAVTTNIPPDFVINAFWCDDCGPGAMGAMFFGNGIPSNFALVATGQNVFQLAGSLDVAAHELTHGVTSSSSNLIYLNESGALNEAFSDMMGTSVEFYFQTPGPGLGQADYLIGEDSFRAARPGSVSGIRSMQNPAMFGDPDHYSRRFLGPEDNGGVHINAGIATHAFYLAIEGGTNRTSGLSVVGVGAANREQIEKVFYRAFVFLLPANATFSTARAATIQAARDLYPANAAVVNAVTQAWTAVGVN
ncbi:MAG TPA: M4 family metallopeptidase [Vicinamibacterales bacterium]